MKLHVPATWYRAKAIIVRRWGWSPIELAVLLSLREKPGTSFSVSSDLCIRHQIAEAAISRLMRFGLIEIRFDDKPCFQITKVTNELLVSGRPLPERSKEREIFISIVIDKLGGSIFRRRDVKLLKPRSLPENSIVIDFPEVLQRETDETMEQDLRSLLSGSLRPGESFVGVRQLHSTIVPRFIQIDLNEAQSERLPEGTSKALKQHINKYLSDGVLPKIATQRIVEHNVYDTHDVKLSPDQIIAGGEKHLNRLEEVVNSAKSDIFVLSTFVASQNDTKAELGQNRVWEVLEHACRRGVRVHLFFGSALDKEQKHADAMISLYTRLRRVGGSVYAYSETVNSHAKMLIADDGLDGAIAIIGSCNWLQSPFRAHELSLEISNDRVVSECLALLRRITSSTASASVSRDSMQTMQSALEGSRQRLSDKPIQTNFISAQIRILLGPDHLPTLREAAHSARQRFVCFSHKFGAPMLPNLFDPAQIAGERIDDVRAYFSLPTGPMKKRHIRRIAGELEQNVKVTQSQRKSPMLHAKVLLWDNDDAVISSFNWGSQSASEDKPLDEIGLHVCGNGIAELVHSKLVELLEQTSRE